VAGTDWQGAGGQPARPGAEGSQAPGSSLPWQDRNRYPSAMSALWQTIKAVLLGPTRAFSQIRVQDSLGSSLLYVLILGTVGGYIGLVWQIAFRSLSLAAVAATGARAETAAAFALSAFHVVLSIVVIPIAAVIVSFIWAGILHLCLYLLGGAKESFEATYAVVAYSMGSTALLGIVPVCGGLIGGIWALVAEILGLTAAHRTTTGRAVVAVLLPIVLCCGCILLLWALIFAMAATQAAGGL